MRPTLLTLAGVALLLTGLFTPWTQGEQVPYAAGENTPQARASARTAGGYVSDNVVVFEGDVLSVAVLPRDTNGFWVAVGSQGPQIFFSARDNPPAISTGDPLRVWTMDAGTGSPGGEMRQAIRVESNANSWIAPSWEFGNNTSGRSVPVFYQHGSGLHQSGVHFGGMAAGSILTLGGLFLLYRRQPAFPVSQPLDHVSIWCGCAAVLVAIIGLEYFQDLSGLLLISMALGFVAIGTGAGRLIQRKPGQPWWPSSAGLIAGVAVIIFVAVVIWQFLSHLMFA